MTLIELLTVLTIIAIIATIGLPAMRGLNRGNRLEGGMRQMLDDLSLARLRAIGSRSEVYLVFVGPDVVDRFQVEPDPRVKALLANLAQGQYTAYALLSARTVGDQPGRYQPRYLSEWKRLPEGLLIPPHKFRTNRIEIPMGGSEYFDGFQRVGLPFPTATNFSGGYPMPCIGFDPAGQLVSKRDEIVPLAEGSVFVREAQGQVEYGDAIIRPPDNYTNNYIRINWLTGRAALERPVLPQ